MITQGMHPGTIKEWDVFDGAVTAHKHLRKLDTDSLRQLELPLASQTPKRTDPRPDCPRCNGTGQFQDPDREPGTSFPCLCKDVEDEAWTQVKIQWQELMSVLIREVQRL